MIPVCVSSPQHISFITKQLWPPGLILFLKLPDIARDRRYGSGKCVITILASTHNPGVFLEIPHGKS